MSRACNLSNCKVPVFKKIYFTNKNSAEQIKQIPSIAYALNEFYQLEGSRDKVVI